MTIKGTSVSTHGAIVRFGKYEGELLTRVPYGYLAWAVAQEVEGNVQLKDGRMVYMCRAAKAELERRGERLQDVEISSHAIDKATSRFLSIFLDNRKKGEGVVTWLERNYRALDLPKCPGTHIMNQQFGKKQIRWVIDTRFAIPIIKTLK